MLVDSGQEKEKTSIEIPQQDIGEEAVILADLELASSEKIRWALDRGDFAAARSRTLEFLASTPEIAMELVDFAKVAGRLRGGGRLPEARDLRNRDPER
jgi:hypothetical protein